MNKIFSFFADYHNGRFGLESGALLQESFSLKKKQNKLSSHFKSEQKIKIFIQNVYQEEPPSCHALTRHWNWHCVNHPVLLKCAGHALNKSSGRLPNHPWYPDSGSRTFWQLLRTGGRSLSIAAIIGKSWDRIPLLQRGIRIQTLLEERPYLLNQPGCVNSWLGWLHHVTPRRGHQFTLYRIIFISTYAWFFALETVIW